MVSERNRKIGRSLSRFFSYFKHNRDAATVMLAGSIVTMIVSIVIVYLSVITGNINKSNNLLIEIGTGIIPPVIEISASLVIFLKESMSKSMGGLGVLMALLSLPGSEGGLLIGFILVLIGGAMSILYKSPYVEQKSRKM
ncbi:MAG: DUF6114 domain-containing protein [Cuniculiplasma sp.]